MGVREILYEDDQLRAIWCAGDSDFVLVTFSDLVSRAEGDRFFADTPVVKGAISCLGLVAKRPNWFPGRNVEAAIRAAAPRLVGYRSRIVYGGSMGGYAAIKFSRRLAATEVLALCPQWSIDPAECGDADRRYEAYYDPAMAAMGIRAGDASGRIFLFCDPGHAADAWHRNRIVENAVAVSVVDMHASDHHVTSILAGTANLLSLIGACRRDAGGDLRDLVNAIRRRHFLRAEIVLERASASRPRIVGRILRHRIDRDARYREIGLKLACTVIAALLAGSLLEDAAALLEVLRHVGHDRDGIRHGLLLSLIARRSSRIRTHHGTIMVYDVARGVCAHAETEAALLSDGILMPLRIRLDHDQAWILLGSASMPALVAPDPAGTLVIAEPADPAADPAANGVAPFAVERDPHGRFALRHGGRYVSANADGVLVCNRTRVLDWELFRLGAASAPPRGQL